MSTLSIFRESSGQEELSAALRFLGLDGLPQATRLFVLADIADEGGFPVAAALIQAQGAVWRVARVRCEEADAPRLAEELVRRATAAGATQLVSAPPPERSGGAVLRHAVVAASVRDGCVVVDL